VRTIPDNCYERKKEKKGPVTNGFQVRTVVVGVTSMGMRLLGEGVIACSKDRRLIACLLALILSGPALRNATTTLGTWKTGWTP